jgi:hypothetical protein
VLHPRLAGLRAAKREKFGARNLCLARERFSIEMRREKVWSTRRHAIEFTCKCEFFRAKQMNFPSTISVRGSEKFRAPRFYACTRAASIEGANLKLPIV